MTRFKTGDDVIVKFDGYHHAGEVEKVEHGWVYCRIAIDVVGDYGSITPRLAPHSTVCVREHFVQHADSNAT